MMNYPLVIFTGKGRSGKDTAAKVLCEELGGAAFAQADPIKRFFWRAGLTAEQLWGKDKETPIPKPDIAADHAKFWLSEALCGWLTPAQLMRIGFGPWVEGLPSVTTPRHLMQTFGTECVRSYSPDLWADFGLYVAEELLAGRKSYDRAIGLVERTSLAAPPALVVITDGRFRNEVLKVKARGGRAYRIERGSGTQEGFTQAAREHASESEQDSIPPWWFDGTLYNSGSLLEFEKALTLLATYDLSKYR